MCHIYVAFWCEKKKGTDQSNLDNNHLSICTFWQCCISNNSLITNALVVPACPVAHHSHEIEPQPCPAAANARGYGTLQPVIPLALQKASDSLCSSSLHCRWSGVKERQITKQELPHRWKRGKPSKTVCYRCFHGDQLRFGFDNVECCQREEDFDMVFCLGRKEQNILQQSRWFVQRLRLSAGAKSVVLNPIYHSITSLF